jgi:hypothetical protein
LRGEPLDRRVPPDQMKLLHRSARKKDTDEPVFDIDLIIDHRGKPGQYEYLIKWKGYSDEDNTWEPAVNFIDDKCIQDYWKSQNTD